MSKAYDSIGIEPLCHALTRIKLLSLAIEFIINLFSTRRIKIITEYGLSDDLVAKDGIDQGEVISPLIWQIFYDLLLYRIQDDPNLGYNMDDVAVSFQWNQKLYSYPEKLSRLLCVDT